MHGSIERDRSDDIPVIADDMPLDAAAARDASTSTLLFFCPDVTDASTLKRVQQFMDFGYRVTVFGFRRERYNTDYQPPWPNVPLGFTTDGRYWQRLSALAARHSRRCSPTAAALAQRFDLLRPQYRPAPAGAAGASDRLLARADRLRGARHSAHPDAAAGWCRASCGRSSGYACVASACWCCPRPASIATTSSPSRNMRGEWFLLENKLLPFAFAVTHRAARLAGPDATGLGWSAISA